MKTNKRIRTTSAGLMAVALMAIGSTTALAAPPALQPILTLRPLTTTEQNTYGVTNLQQSSGISTIGIGQPAYLDALVNAAIAPSNVVSVTWSLTSKPLGSSAVLAPTPLGTGIPTFKSADLYKTDGTAYDQVAWPGGLNTGIATNNGRTLLIPDSPGQYTVKVTIVTAGGSGTTNLTQNITAAYYKGISTCTLCHSGGIQALDIYHTWSETPHATFFSRAIDGQVSSHYSKNCISCHTVGYDASPISSNYWDGGFSDIAATNGWVFPAPLTNNPSNWASMQVNYPELANLANIQCENCHGPGSEHAYSLGNTNFISRTFIAGDCAKCHDAAPQHIKDVEWNISLHARASRTPSGAGREACVRCHTAAGFYGWASAGGMAMQNKVPTNIITVTLTNIPGIGYTNIITSKPNTAYEAITCQACHDPHNDSQPHQLRLGNNVTLSDGTVVTNAGSGGFCMECHNNRDGSYTNMLAQYPLGKMTWAGGSAFGTHDSPQADILEGVNAETYGKVIPSAAHANVISNTCAGCHMQTVASTDPGYLKAGGHTFNMTYTNNLGVEVPLTAVCTKCHGKVDDFDMVVSDYNGDGIIEGVQTEVQHLLDKLSPLLPPKVYQSNPANYVGDGVIKTTDSQMATYTNVPAKYLKAYYNWDIVYRDGSLGVHNAPFVVGLLKASIADLTGDANNDGLPDSWQAHYFGTYTNALAAPNASPAGDGVPNWLKYSLGLDPMVAGIVLPDGVVWVNTSSIGGETNTVHLYTAAEIAFDTEVGKSYQIQSISNLGGGWTNVGSPMPGTGTTISYLTPTRNGAQQFFRVVHTP